MYYEKVFLSNHRMEVKLKFYLEGVHPKENHLEDHHSIHIWIMWMANT
jgi:hypothetical protein